MGIWSYFAQAGRAVRSAPVFTLLVVLILAIGIGANTAIFTLLDAALLRPLPYRDASQLVFVDAVDRTTADETGCLSYPHFTLLASRNRSFASIAAFTSENYNFRGRTEPFQVQAAIWVPL
jgi:putative ABC transport system permease protein